MGRNTSRRVPRRVLLPLAAAGHSQRRGERGGAAKNRPATGPLTDVDYMRAMHNALRRGLARLDPVVLDPAGPAQLSPQPAQACADLRGRLDRHHVARDKDPWPVLRRQLADPQDQPHIDRMVDERRKLSTLIMKVDDAITIRNRCVRGVRRTGSRRL
jgi:hypothetical protein